MYERRGGRARPRQGRALLNSRPDAGDNLTAPRPKRPEAGLLEPGLLEPAYMVIHGITQHYRAIHGITGRYTALLSDTRHY